MNDDPLAGVPAHLRGEIERTWETRVKHGRERFRRDGDRGVGQAQKEISALLKDHGIRPGTDGRYERVIAHGRWLNKLPSEAQKTDERPGFRRLRSSLRTAGDPEGKVYTPGDTFRARAEAHQRRYRATVLGAGWERYGHLLDGRAAERGLNFVHPSALAAARARAEAGKGVDRKRTWGNMLASQAMCFNLFGPLSSRTGGLAIATDALSGFVSGLVGVESIEIEHTPARDLFHDQSARAGVDCDVLIVFRHEDGSSGVFVIETKYVETEFSRCGHRKASSADPCPDDVELLDDFTGCRYTSRNRYLYWGRSRDHATLAMDRVRSAGCPFSGPLWQLWVNHTLAHVIASRRGARHARFAVCAPEGNTALLRDGALMDEFCGYLANPDSALFLPLEALLGNLSEACERAGDEWSDWARALADRYLVDEEIREPAGGAVGFRPTGDVVTAGHRRTIAWMATPAFRRIVEVHEEALGPARIYFRPTDSGVVMIGLHDRAPRYVAFRTSRRDQGFKLGRTATAQTVDDVRRRWTAFEKWLPTVKGPKDEERGLIPLLRRALRNQLWLDELGDGWVFLHQEWRFVDETGGGNKSDFLAVHLPTGQIGIVEFKSSPSKLDEARHQVRQYGRYWSRDADELAPFFTDLLRAMGGLYGNGRAAEAVVSTAEAQLFVGVASPHEARVTVHGLSG